MANKIFIVAGDVSGEKYAADLVKAIKEADPQAYVYGLGGSSTQIVVDEFLCDIVSLSAFGFSEPLKQYVKLKKIFNKRIRDLWKKNKPDKVILVDYYGFNIHVAELAHSQSIPVYYYISPQVWASRPKRINKLARYVKKMLVILPFEKEIYTKAGLDTTFVGHPLIDMVPEIPVEKKNKILLEHPIIGLFPGSRPHVIKRHLPILTEAAEIINKEVPAHFEIFGLKDSCTQYDTSPFHVVYDNDYSHRRKLTMCITVSGTVSLENALLGLPMVVFYRLSLFNYTLAKMITTVPYITMVNILAKREVVPEMIQKDATPQKIAEEALTILMNEPHYFELKRQLLSFRRKLGEPGVSRRAAKIILND